MAIAIHQCFYRLQCSGVRYPNRPTSVVDIVHLGWLSCISIGATLFTSAYKRTAMGSKYYTFYHTHCTSHKATNTCQTERINLCTGLLFTNFHKRNLSRSLRICGVLIFVSTDMAVFPNHRWVKRQERTVGSKRERKKSIPSVTETHLIWSLTIHIRTTINYVEIFIALIANFIFP